MAFPHLGLIFGGIALVAMAACGNVSSSPPTEPLCEADPGRASALASVPELADRPLPDWYADAKLGIMIHWGPFAIPAWAERTLDPEVIFTDPTDPDYFLTPRGVERFLSHNPYSEWYWNSISIPGSGASEHHAEAWGEGFPYERFGPMFVDGLAGWDPDEWAQRFRSAGARYVVLVSKHHDGYTLWPSGVENPYRSGWASRRDVVGELSQAVRGQCLKMGLYYSGGIDWTFTAPPFATFLDALRLTPAEPAYARYVDAHWRELIERYRPSVLWNDITAPPGTDPEALFHEYYAAVPDGVVNDRWAAATAGLHRDFATAEFSGRADIDPEKWEAVRGMGRGFGYNRNEQREDYGPPAKFIHLLSDVVSKNGNLLLNVGPRADGSIPEEQQAILDGLGDWLAINGTAIYGTRPWQRFGGLTDGGLPVRFTWNAARDTLYAIVLGRPAGQEVTLLDLALTPADVHLLGADGALEWEAATDGLRLQLPSSLPEAAAYVFALAGADGP